MTFEDRWLLPEGVEEILPNEAKRLECLRRRVLDLFECWGYRQVVPPFIEFLDSLLVGTGSDLDLQTFKLIDQVSGRMLGVRADMTPQVARIDARSHVPGVPQRLCYLGTVLHTHADHLETSRSPMQVGAELYGHAGPDSDVEVIRLMLNLFDVAALEDVHLDLGHVGVYRHLVGRAGLDATLEGELFEILQRKARPELHAFLERCGTAADARQGLLSLIDLHGDWDDLRSLAEQLLPAGDPGIEASLAELIDIGDRLRREYPHLPIHFDLAELRGYHYHAGIVFAAFVPGYGREVARGGRYDEVGRLFGASRPATGFSADLKVLVRFGRFDTTPALQRSAFAPSGADAGLRQKVADLRADGWTVIEELAGQSADAGSMGCSHELRCRDGRWELLAAVSPEQA